MNLKIVVDKKIDLGNNRVILIRGSIFEVDSIVVDEYKIRVPMKQKGKFRYALVKDEEGELID